MVPVGGAGVRGAGGSVYLAVAGGFAAIVVGIGGLAGIERGAAARHADDAGMAGGQFMGSDAESDSLFCDRIAGGLRGGTFFGDAAAIAGAPDRAAAFCGVSGVLLVAAGGTEFFLDESVAVLFWAGVAGGVAGRSAVCGVALAESGAGAADAAGRGGDVVAVRAGAEHFAAGARA